MWSPAARTATGEQIGLGGDGHGAIAGVAEVAEPRLHLIAIDAEGAASMLDLLTRNRVPGGVAGRRPMSVLMATTSLQPLAPAWTLWIAAYGLGITWTAHSCGRNPKTLGRVAGGAQPIATGMLRRLGTAGLFFPSSRLSCWITRRSPMGLSQTLRLKTEPHAGILCPHG